MKIVASLTDADKAVTAQENGADVLEFRLDLMGGDPVSQLRQCRELVSIPVIGTIRSAREGGRFFGNAQEWYDKVQPIIPFVDYVDVEQHFAMHAPLITSAGKTIIASHHTNQMLSLPDLFGLERTLRAYGDIPKIIVTPSDKEDVINLLSFTLAAKKPICTGVMGSMFRWVRLMLPFFGSELVYCHGGSETAEGQYSVEECANLLKRMKTYL
jgi:3-dehydroquinate dehydratase I